MSSIRTKPNTVEFELKEEHIKLAAKLHMRVSVDTEYDDSYIPEIDRKRPFGNGGATYSVMEILEWQRGEDGEYDEKSVRAAEMLLIELPVALEIIFRNQTFTPGIYEVDEYGAYYNYTHVRNYRLLQKPLKEIESNASENERKYMHNLREMCMNVSGTDPYRIINDLKMFHSVPFIKKAIRIFKKYQEETEVQ